MQVRKRGRLLANLTNRGTAEWPLKGLEAGSVYEVSIYASNGKGQSPRTSAVIFTTQDPGTTLLPSRIAGRSIDYISYVDIFNYIWRSL